MGIYQIVPGHFQQPPGVVVDVTLHGGKDFGGMILLPLGVQRERWIERRVKDLARHAEFLVERLLQPSSSRASAFSPTGSNCKFVHSKEQLAI